MDEVIRSELHYQPHTDELIHARTQPTEGLIYERNAELRKDSVLSDLSFGRQVASIPIIAWERAIRAGYDLANPDGDIAGKEIMRFLRSEEGQLCIVGKL